MDEITEDERLRYGLSITNIQNLGYFFDPYSQVWRNVNGSNRSTNSQTHSNPNQGAGGPNAGAISPIACNSPCISWPNCPCYNAAARTSGLSSYPSQSLLGAVGQQSALNQAYFNLVSQQYIPKTLGQAWQSNDPNHFAWGNSPDRKDLEHKITLGELVAYRCWRYDLQMDVLRSTNFDYVWAYDEPATLNSNVPLGEKQKRELDVYQDQGIYCFKSQQDAIKRVSDDQSCEFLIVGSISIWGTVIEHEHGYRAEFARVRSLDNMIQLVAENHKKDWNGVHSLLNHLRSLYLKTEEPTID